MLDHVRNRLKDEEQGWKKEARLIVQCPPGSGIFDASREREYFEWLPDMKRVMVFLGQPVRNKEELKQSLDEKNVFKKIKGVDS